MSTQNPYDDKLNQAQTLVNTHNSNLSDDANKIDWDTFVSQLKQLGGTTDDALKSVTWEDLQECGLPKILARTIANDVFRKSHGNKKQLLTHNRIAAMDHEELLQHYDPTGECNETITEVLNNKSGGQRFIIFDDSGAVLVKDSAILLKELRQNFPERETITVDGKLYKTYRVGEQPNEYFDEHPALPGTMLRARLTCDRTNRSWARASLKARQIVRLACTRTGELNIRDNDDLHRVMDNIVNENSEEAAERFYPRAAIMLLELLETNEAPSLRIKPSQACGRTNNPFTTR